MWAVQGEKAKSDIILLAWNLDPALIKDGEILFDEDDVSVFLWRHINIPELPEQPPREDAFISQIVPDSWALMIY